MNETLIIILLVFLLFAIPLMQHFRFKKRYAGYKNVKTAIQQESNRLSSLKSQIEATVAQTEDCEARMTAAIKKKEEAQAVLEQSQSMIANFENLIKKMRGEAIDVKNELSTRKADLKVQQDLQMSQAAVLSQLAQEKADIETRIAHLVSLESRELTLVAEVEALASRAKVEQLEFEKSRQRQKSELLSLEGKLISSKNDLSALMGRVDLYSRVDEYTRVGHFEMPNYLYETSVRYQSEIKEVRERQRKLIREKKAITYPDELTLCSNKALDKKILDGQVQLMLNAFNIECDLLIDKVNPANLDRTLEQIEKRAETLEKSCATLKCGFNLEYVELKFEECKFQFECVLKKNEEQEEPIHRT